MLLRVYVPKQAVAANKVFFDLFLPAASPYRAEIVSIQPVVSGAVAVIGVLGVDLMLTRTSAAGTGGTAAAYGGATLTAMQISVTDSAVETSSAVITGRLTPTAGATAGAVLSQACVFTEETSVAAYIPALDLANTKNDFVQGIVMEPNTGIRVVQGAVASVGNIGFNCILNLMPT